MPTDALSSRPRQHSIAFKIVAVLVSAFATGFMWRARGSHGFGAMWGMFAVAAAMCLFFFYVFGDRKKNIYEMFTFTVFATAVTVGGWGTLNRQMSGFFETTSLLNEAQTSFVEISPLIGLSIMLMLGFGWMPFFGFLMGRFFTDRSYKIKDFIFAAVIFYAVHYLFKVSLAHPILDLLHPEAVRLFETGLAENGLDTNTWLMFLKHFDSMNWAKKLTGGRNYFTTIEVISNTFAAIALLLYQRFGLKDKLGVRVNLGSNIVMALSITLADIFLVMDAGAPYLGGYKPKIFKGYAWSYWEYFTGFLLGFGLMILFFIADKKLKSKWNVADSFPEIPRKLKAAYNAVFTLSAGLGLTLIRPFISRIYEQEFTPTGKRIYHSLEQYNAVITSDPNAAAVYWDIDVPMVVAYIVICGVVLAVFSYIVHKNMIRKRLDTPVAMSFSQFCKVTFPVYFVIVAALYFFTNGADAFNPKQNPISILMFVTFFIVALGIALLYYIDSRNKKPFCCQ